MFLCFRFAAYLFKCSLPTRKRPDYVSIVRFSCAKSHEVLLVHSTSPRKGKYSVQFTVCLMPLYFNYSRGYELVEWIELNRILGAERFTVYVKSCASNVEDILKYYKGIGVVDVVQWNLPVDDIHYFGQVAALQDCLYRNKASSRYIVNIDLDEFIIPHKRDVFTWNDIVAKYNRNKSMSFNFRNVFFRKEWLGLAGNYKFSGSALAAKYNMITLLLSEHEAKVFPIGSRSKYIARTALATFLLIHDVRGTGYSVRVPQDVALLHHYRNWSNYSNVEARITDNTVLKKYGVNLTHNVQYTWKQLPNVFLGQTDE